MPLGLLKKVGNYRWTGGPGAAPWWGFKGRSPLEARAFSQSELPRKPPIDTHGRYTCIQYMHGGTKERRKKKKKKKKEKKKSEGPEKVGIPTKVGKTASLLTCTFNHEHFAQ